MTLYAEVRKALKRKKYWTPLDLYSHVSFIRVKNGYKNIMQSTFEREVRRMPDTYKQERLVNGKWVQCWTLAEEVKVA